MRDNEQKIIIVGCARSGLAAAKLAREAGCVATVYDQKAYTAFHQEVQEVIDELKGLGISFYLNEEVSLLDYDLIVMSPGVPTDLPFLEAARQQGKKIIGELEYAFTFCKAPVIAITGTNGKTTTTTLVGQIMKAYNKETYVVGNIGRAFSEDVLNIPEDGIVVAEVSSFQLETIETFHPKVAAILNITPDHLNRHKTMENYCQAKYSVFKNQTAADAIIINENDPYFAEVKRLAAAQVITFNNQQSTHCGAYQQGDYLYENIAGEKALLCAVKALKIVGAHNIENALAAIAICTAFGVPRNIIMETLKTFMGVEHRLEYVCTKAGVDYYNDSKATNVGAAIPGLLGMHKPIRLIGGGMDKKISFAEWVALFKGRVQKLYLIGECKNQIMDECRQQGFLDFEAYNTFEEAIQACYLEAQNEECVLLSPACASWDMFESYEQRGDLFKEIV
ncbi:MAG: UDP-N-acetylmuramoyl-L-alanine--D-glutamate ligase, partial [Niameybacter sp.]